MGGEGGGDSRVGRMNSVLDVDNAPQISIIVPSTVVAVPLTVVIFLNNVERGFEGFFGTGCCLGAVDATVFIHSM